MPKFKTIIIFILDKSECFKSKKRENEEQDSEDASGQTNSSGNRQSSKTPQIKNSREQATLKTRTVLFIEQTKDGKLAKNIKSVLARIEHILGFKIKVVEITGTSIRKLLSNTKRWVGSHFSREELGT